MSYKFLEHTADVGIECSGETIEEAFEEGGKALFEVMVDIQAIQPIEMTTFTVEADSIENLFVEYLNRLIALKDINESVYSEFEVEIIEKDEKFTLNCLARGEMLNQEKHNIKIEVKSATYYGLKYNKGTNTLTTVLDV